MTVLFPDIEKYLVAYLTDALAATGHPAAAGARVATVKTPPGATQPPAEVILTGAYNASLDPVRRAASLVIDVYADDYDTASTLALLTGAVIVQCPGDVIKRAVVSLGPLRLPEDGPQEKRSMTVDLTVKGEDL